MPGHSGKESRRGALVVSVIAVMGLVLASCGGGSTEASGPASGEGVAVHAEWTIDVYDEGGSLDEHREFSNALTDGGIVLAALLSRQWDAGPWKIVLSRPENAAYPDMPCAVDGTVQSSCNIWDDATVTPDPTVSNNLLVTATESVEGSGVNDAVLLSGSIAASNDGDIGIVATNHRLCADGVPPTLSCPGATYDFSEKRLIDANGAWDPIPVTTGQQITVEVLITFTTG